MSDLHQKWQAYQALQKEIAALQEKATLLMMEGRAAAIGDIKALITAYDLKADELGFPATAPAAPKRVRKPEKRRDRTMKNPPKYRDPETGLTWTGNGRVPDWLVGKDYNDYLIEKTQVETPAIPYDPPASPAVDASHAVQQMVSSSMPAPAAAWPGGVPGLSGQQ